MTSADRILRTEIPLVVGDGQSVPNAPVNTGKTEQAVFRNGQWVEFWSTAHAVTAHLPVADFSWTQSSPSATTSTATTGPTGIDGTQTTTTTTNSYTVSFSGLASFEISGRIVQWDWTFGDGGTGSGSTVSHVYTGAATYSVSLKVTDANGVTATTTKPVTVSANPVSQPRAAFTDVVTGYDIAFDGSPSTTTNGATIVRWDWAFGDGSTATGQTTTHTYAGGTYTVTLKVTDSYGYTASGSLQVSTSNKNPVPSFTTSIAGRAVTVDASGSIDPDGSIVAYAWDFGDGGTASGMTPATHTYTADGAYTIRLVVTDNDGAQTAASKSVTVAALAVDYIVGAASTSSTLVPASTAAVLQQFLRSPDTGEFYSSQVHPESNGFESVRLSRMAVNGALIDQMVLTDAGHGTTFALEYTGGQMYIWLTWHRGTDNTTIVDDLVRFPYTAGTFTRSQVAGLTVKIAGPTYRLVAFDYGGGYAVVSTSGTYTRYALTDVLAGNLSTPLNSIRLAESPPTMQGFATYYDSFFRYTGQASDSATYSTDKPTIVEYSWKTGAVVRTLDTSAFGGTASRTEPEGLSIYNTGTNPVLFFGVTTGPVGGPHTYPTWWYPLSNPAGGGGGGGGGGSGNTAKSPWLLGSVTEGLPSTVRVVKWADLATSSSDNNNPMVAINRLTAPSLVDISGEQLTIPTFSVLSSTNPTGIGHRYFNGFIGGINNGVFDNLVQLAPNALTSAQLATIAAQVSGDTTRAVVIRTSSAIAGTGNASYFMGVHFVGGDQGKITEAGAGTNGNQYSTAPGRYAGIDVALSGAGSIFQNCLMQGFNSSDGNGPPFETGQWNSRRTTGFVIRRSEFDGILPIGSPSRPTSSSVDPYGRGWKRTGGLQWNADKQSKMYNVSIHSGLVSGLTYSVAGTTNNGSSNSGDIYTQNLYVEDQSTKGFSGTNLEDVLGSLMFDHPIIKMNGTGGYHLKLNPDLQGLQAPNITNWQVIEPTWSGLGFNGMFAIGIRGWGTMQTTAPVVTKNGVKLTATTSSTADPTRYYHIQAL